MTCPCERTISQQSCERNPSRSQGALEDRVRQGKICEQGGGGKRNNSVRDGDITNHHRHKKGPRDPHSMRGSKGLRDPRSVRGSNVSSSRNMIFSHRHARSAGCWLARQDSHRLGRKKSKPFIHTRHSQRNEALPAVQ